MKILENDILNKTLSKKGFVVLDPLAKDVVEQLRSYYTSLQSPIKKGFHPSLMWDNPVQKKEINQNIRTLIEEWVSTHFCNHRILYCNFMVKEPGEESRMQLHQDWSYVDEKNDQSFAIWFPLQDLNDQNGPLSMIPYSHLFQNHNRGPGVHCPFQKHEEYIISEFGIPLFLKEGQPVVWEHHLLHYSPPNYSEQSRLAVTAIIVPKDKNIYHYYQSNGNTEIHQYQVENDFYFHYNIVDPPNNFALKINDLSSEFFNYEKKQLDEKLRIQKRFNWWTKIKKLFK